MDNHFASVRFSRTQPREWRDIPFSDDRAWLRDLRDATLAGILWIALFALSIWSISESMK